MTSATIDHDIVDHDDHDHPTDGFFWKIGAILALLTAAEVSTIWWVDWGIPGRLTHITLLAMMSVKFVMVAMYFMHLKYDQKLLRTVFFFGLILAGLVYLAGMSAMVIFDDNSNVVIEDAPYVRPIPPPPTDPPAIPTGGGH
jgi:cytochrome c oxidase subunit 4